MLRCELRDVNGQSHIMTRLLSLQVDVDENVPADALYATFAEAPTQEFVELTLFDDDTPLFVGVVDEEEHICGAKGITLRVSARSMAAHLLDNEAMPCEYDHPSLSLIYERYVKPYGIAPGDDADAVFFGEQSITKGTSCWKALKSFCIACFSSVPRISSVGVLYPKGMRHDKCTVFGEKGIPFTALRVLRKRCEEISCVRVKATNVGTYSLSIDNPSAQERGIRRVRYLNAVLTESPMRCADAMIANGSSKAFTVHLRCEGCLLGHEGNHAVLESSFIKDTDDLVISAVHYRMTGDGDYSNITLKRRTN